EKYLLLRNGEEIDTTTETSYTNSNLNENTTYTYTVVAFRGDMASKQSKKVTVSTKPNPEAEKESSNDKNNENKEDQANKSEKPCEESNDTDELAVDTKDDSSSSKFTSVTSASYDTISISLDKVEDADLYRIMRNGKEVGTTKETSFTAKKLTE